MWEILFEILAGYWSGCYFDRLSNKRSSYTKIFFTTFAWISFALGLLLILDGTFKISRFDKFFIGSVLFSAGYTAVLFIVFCITDFLQSKVKKNTLEKSHEADNS